MGHVTVSVKKLVIVDTTAAPTVGYIKEHESSVFTFAYPLLWCIIFSFT